MQFSEKNENNILDFLKTLGKILDVDNDAFCPRVKFQLKTLCILSDTKIQNLTNFGGFKFCTIQYFHFHYFRTACNISNF
jgi:hypothetical protein